MFLYVFPPSLIITKINRMHICMCLCICIYSTGTYIWLWANLKHRLEHIKNKWVSPLPWEQISRLVQSYEIPLKMFVTVHNDYSFFSTHIYTKILFPSFLVSSSKMYFRTNSSNLRYIFNLPDKWKDVFKSFSLLKMIFLNCLTYWIKHSLTLTECSLTLLVIK